MGVYESRVSNWMGNIHPSVKHQVKKKKKRKTNAEARFFGEKWRNPMSVDGNDHRSIVTVATHKCCRRRHRVKVSFTCLLLAEDASDRIHPKYPIAMISYWRSFDDASSYKRLKKRLLGDAILLRITVH
ncbi:hypothetical protein CDAR_577551 [Caerostris darwini]|uniref:Uncharacterized protein n=1 Tax=Caerostris darwini TaxID=1538125 RepID=A0AAV4SGM9_9ARAC|nr:hypothetical protein CDAR_577551 [Caerostris darwini]